MVWGPLAQLVQVVLSREDMDANDMLETLRQLVEAAPDQVTKQPARKNLYSSHNLLPYTPSAFKGKLSAV